MNLSTQVSSENKQQDMPRNENPGLKAGILLYVYVYSLRGNNQTEAFNHGLQQFSLQSTLMPLNACYGPLIDSKPLKGLSAE